ncbi:hypothetical protein AMAG_02478 [Allomyces macrogynus ATCC 38327]|uniref:Coatomer subunit epsilon n=1 Tax=Allomyces macrogynus (strain ATCC 38327) TaxID=578462 RepID=A0A0L0S2R8_ALLM3|nr:hypothetical protein AMAG_02478 [Allomyces macrogynus ATCC 38327]|eukprot:KNE56696.1 hypothetical protein AMAG_02478 [Allomyces macrogynus ATCC 38327]
MDDNYQARALYAVGHAGKLQELLAARPSDPERLLLVVRALLNQDRRADALAVLDQASPAGAEFGAARIATADTPRAETATALRALLDDPVKAGNVRARVVVGEALLRLDLVEDAIKAAASGAIDKDIDCAAVLVRAYLKLDRADLARSLADQLSTYPSADSHAITIQVLEGLVHLAQGGPEHVQQAQWIWDELIQTYAASPLLLNLVGATNLVRKQPADAARYFTEAALMDPQDADAAANAAIAAAVAGKENGALLSQLCTQHPGHPLAVALASKADMFDRLAAQYAA